MKMQLAWCEKTDNDIRIVRQDIEKVGDKVVLKQPDGSMITIVVTSLGEGVMQDFGVIMATVETFDPTATVPDTPLN